MVVAHTDTERDTMNPSNDQDIHQQVNGALGYFAEDFDTYAIVAHIINDYGIVDIDSIDTDDFWTLTFQHEHQPSRHVAEFSAQYWQNGRGHSKPFDKLRHAERFLLDAYEQGAIEPIRVVRNYDNMLMTGETTAWWNGKLAHQTGEQ